MWVSRPGYTAGWGSKKRNTFIKHCICYTPDLALSPELSCHHLHLAVQTCPARLSSDSASEVKDIPWPSLLNPPVFCRGPHNILYLLSPLNWNYLIVYFLITHLMTISEVHKPALKPVIKLLVHHYMWCPYTMDGVQWVIPLVTD